MPENGRLLAFVMAVVDFSLNIFDRRVFDGERFIVFRLACTNDTSSLRKLCVF